MRNILLAGVALVGVSAFMTQANAQSAPAPTPAPTVFPTNSRAGQLDGAAPGSVTVTLGGRIFGGIEVQGGTGDTGPYATVQPNLVNYIRLYPQFDYVNPSGIHFGVSMELRTEGAFQGFGAAHNTLFGFAGQGYVKSDKFGTFAFGTPNSATDDLAVGTGDNYGTGGFYSEYGWVNAPIFAMADAYDGDTPHQKLAYTSPTFAGFKGAISYQPTSVGLNNSGGLVTNLPASGANLLASPVQSKNRIEVAAQYAHTFGSVGLKASLGWAGAGASVVGNTGGYQNVNMFTGGASVTVAGFEIEGSVVTGKWAYNYNDAGAPFGPSLDGASNTTSFIVGVGYTLGPWAAGVQYYGVDFNVGDFANNAAYVNEGGTVSGVALGASYAVGPGVSVALDVATNETKSGTYLQTTNDGTKHTKTNGTMGGLGMYIQW